MHSNIAWLFVKLYPSDDEGSYSSFIDTESGTHAKVQCMWGIYCDGCIHSLVGVECLARLFKDRDEVKWVLQKWEKEV